MSQAHERLQSEGPGDDLEALRLAEECARSALASSENSLAALERAEGSLLASEKRMAEVSAAAVVAAGEATEAKLRATEIVAEFRALEDQLAATFEAKTGDERGIQPPGADSAHPVTVRPGSSQQEALASHHDTDGDFEHRWSAFERRVNRVIEQLRALEPGELTVRGPSRPRREVDDLRALGKTVT